MWDKELIITLIVILAFITIFFIWYYDYYSHYFDVNDYKEVIYIIPSDYHNLYELAEIYKEDSDRTNDWVYEVKKLNKGTKWSQLHAGDQIIILVQK